MTQKNNTLYKSIALICIAFIIVIMIILSVVTYRTFSDTMYKKYERQMESIVSYAESCIDNDDMAKCAETYIESKKYKETGVLFERFVDNYKEIGHLYIVKPVFPEDPQKVKYVLYADPADENLKSLGDGDADNFTDDDAQNLKRILSGESDSFYTKKTGTGSYYTLARPLINSKGEHYALLCVDMPVSDIQGSVSQDVLVLAVITMITAPLLIFSLIIWLRFNITAPVNQLEGSVLRLANSAKAKSKPEDLIFIAPKLRANNEIKSLSNSVEKLYSEMKDYVKAVANVENEAKGLQQHMTEINTIAYQDSLTKLKNKAAYAKKSDELMWGIIDKRVSFAIVMIDVNFLKKVNDTYGHDKGDMYIKGACEIMSDVYAHSPIFRIGGDEFVVILEGRDYENKEELLKTIRQRYKESASSDRDPWLKYSAAVGMAIYHPGSDLDVDTVFKRADNDMYHEKIKMKGLRQI